MKKKHVMILLLMGSIVITFLNYEWVDLMIGGVIIGTVAGATKRGAISGAFIGAGIGFLSGTIGLSISCMLLSIGGCDQLLGVSEIIPQFPGSVESAWVFKIVAFAAVFSGMFILLPSALGGGIAGYIWGKVENAGEMDENKT